MLTFIVTLVLWLFAGCPDPNEGVEHPDLDALMVDLETPIGAVRDAGKEIARPSPARPSRPAHKPFGGGSL